jgi:hypothetical protein
MKELIFARCRVMGMFMVEQSIDFSVLLALTRYDEAWENKDAVEEAFGSHCFGSMLWFSFLGYSAC